MSGRATDPSQAVECWRPRGPTSQRLICFAHAGAGAAAFQSWSADLPEELEVCALRLPGRERLIGEVPFQQLPPLIAWTIDVLTPLLTTPFVLFGHSLGALIAFEFARELRRRELPAPRCLFVSGHGAPQLPRRQPPLTGLDDSEFTERVVALEGNLADAFAYPELRALILPTLRADFAVLENYTYLPEPPFEFPLHVYGGAEDPLVPVADLAPWSGQTLGPFSWQIFPGHHFYLHTTQREALLTEVGNACRRVL